MEARSDPKKLKLPPPSRLTSGVLLMEARNASDGLGHQNAKHGNQTKGREGPRGAATQQVAPTEATVLIHGESGTGKELIAHAIHAAGRRSDKPLIKVNCAAMAPTLIEIEFFGHEKGAFTGAPQKRQGRFSLANQGTIFLDEIGELPIDLQSKLLRVLQEGEFEPVGSWVTQKVDVRIIAATNRDLPQCIQEGSFREDLFYRLNVFPVAVPALRERGRDIEILANEFVRQFSQRMQRKILPLPPRSSPAPQGLRLAR